MHDLGPLNPGDREGQGRAVPGLAGEVAQLDLPVGHSPAWPLLCFRACDPCT